MKVCKENRNRKELWIMMSSESFLPIGVQLGSRQSGSGGACDQGAASNYPMSSTSLSNMVSR
jgi:hypothetical protein